MPLQERPHDGNPPFRGDRVERPNYKVGPSCSLSAVGSAWFGGRSRRFLPRLDCPPGVCAAVEPLASNSAAYPQLPSLPLLPLNKLWSAPWLQREWAGPGGDHRERGGGGGGWEQQQGYGAGFGPPGKRGRYEERPPRDYPPAREFEGRREYGGGRGGGGGRFGGPAGGGRFGGGGRGGEFSIGDQERRGGLSLGRVWVGSGAGRACNTRLCALDAARSLHTARALAAVWARNGMGTSEGSTAGMLCRLCHRCVGL